MIKHPHSTLLFAIAACALLFLAACEKHDGEYYFRKKCIAELNGQQYIDQTPGVYAFSPVADITPWFRHVENSAMFRSCLSKERGGACLYFVEIILFTTVPYGFLEGEQQIERIDIEYPNGEPSIGAYVRYCEANGVSYAKVNSELVDAGTFQITSHDTEKGTYNGTFTLPFSEGTLRGKFWF